MTEFICTYSGDREEALIAAVYDDGNPAALAAFEAHVVSCARCRVELDALRGVRGQLARWAPPEMPRQSAMRDPQSAAGDPHAAGRAPQWWRQVPAWAQVAAALLFLGVSAGIANLDVRYDANGLSVRTGWSPRRPADAAAQAPSVPGVRPVAQASTSADSAPWRGDLVTLEHQIRNEMHATSPPVTPPRAAAASDAALLQHVRAIVEESEKRQQRDLALRVAEVLRDVNAQRQTDLVNIRRSLGAVQNDLGVEVLKQRQSLNLLYRASQRQ